MKEKIAEINLLDRQIDELTKFLWLLENSNIKSSYSEKNKEKINEFSKFFVESHLWTGSDNPRYNNKLTDKETMNELSELMKPLLRSKLAEKKSRLDALLK